MTDGRKKLLLGVGALALVGGYMRIRESADNIPRELVEHAPPASAPSARVSTRF